MFIFRLVKLETKHFDCLKSWKNCEIPSRGDQTVDF